MDYNFNGTKLVYQIKTIYIPKIDTKCVKYHIKIFKDRVRL